MVEYWTEYPLTDGIPVPVVGADHVIVAVEALLAVADEIVGRFGAGCADSETVGVLAVEYVTDVPAV